MQRQAKELRTRRLICSTSDKSCCVPQPKSSNFSERETHDLQLVSARSVTDPSPSALLQGYFGSASSRPSSSHRNRSPYSRSHLRSRSTGAALNAPAMTRAHSSPAVHTRAFELSTPSTGSLSPGSPMRSPARPRSPLKALEESGYNPPPRSPSWFDATSGSAIESIQEDSELNFTPRQPIPGPSPMPVFGRSSSLRRRPASPLHSSTPPTSYPASVIDQNVPISTVSSTSNSPSLGPQRFNEAYPPLHHFASSSPFSSIPSTPTSQRSRSPSISSLDTIEDAPDLESEAIETERIERLKLAAERAERAERGEDVDDNSRRRSSLDAPRGFGFTRGGNRERKRWSVCGGERRADLDLETIWED
ncbi:hypothetical protein M409DRAFT_64796 [Zasmidium cellare ATCC 36951]|uniref:Basic proline-rich protein n=1 Tax=Zasmidium cellare ATCC 36951 TaxID=1080233 RepID=A0A6A6CWA7_ZASCE|nr:uncharacterized protein M409DRAFT_64796 [Zasmidium cellare ATCC 36951]KAF2169786.1 hypothetical protein M409DRAFT_64796 [Zasmidium cellare ATCC 36951]